MAWHIKIGNESIGPLTDSELRELANKGSINSATLVSSDGQTWVEAETIAGLSFQPTRPRLPTENGFEAKGLWERAGLNVHIEAGLPNSKEAGQELERRAKLGAAEFEDSRSDLWRRVNSFWIAYFAWHGQEVLGAEITIDRGDEEAFVEEMAQFLWRNRGALRGPSDSQDSKP